MWALRMGNVSRSVSSRTPPVSDPFGNQTLVLGSVYSVWVGVALGALTLGGYSPSGMLPTSPGEGRCELGLPWELSPKQRVLSLFKTQKASHCFPNEKEQT